MKEPCSSLSSYPTTGIVMVTFCAFFAASAGIASEFIYKRDLSVSIWLQNCLLYSFAILINLLLLGAGHLHSQAVGSDLGLFDGLDTWMPWLVVLTMGGMGLCVSAVIKHMSNLAKVNRLHVSASPSYMSACLCSAPSLFLSLPVPMTLATMPILTGFWAPQVYTSVLGIFVTVGLSSVFEDFEISLPFLLSASEVICALYLYVLEKDRQADAERSRCPPSMPDGQPGPKGLLWEKIGEGEPIKPHEKA